MKTLIPILFLPAILIPAISGINIHTNTCRSYCGNLTVDYPFGLRDGCGHPGFRDMLFCVNDVLMFHISSGSYRVLDIDYAYRSFTLHDPHMSTCDTIVLGGKGNGFAVEDWRTPYFNPTADNVFMLIGCSPRSPLFQGFPEKHLPCRNVSGMSCDEFLSCPAWSMVGYRERGSDIQSGFGSGPPECCGVGYDSIKSINLTKLECEGYSSAYSLAPLKSNGPGDWTYGIRVKYSVQGSDAFCRACEATGGSCGYDNATTTATDTDVLRHVCLCGDRNSTTNCDSVTSSSSRKWAFADVFIYLSILMTAVMGSQS